MPLLSFVPFANCRKRWEKSKLYLLYTCISLFRVEQLSSLWLLYFFLWMSIHHHCEAFALKPLCSLFILPFTFPFLLLPFTMSRNTEKEKYRSQLSKAPKISLQHLYVFFSQSCLVIFIPIKLLMWKFLFCSYPLYHKRLFILSSLLLWILCTS